MATESTLEYEIERLRDRTRHNEASALGHAKREAIKETAVEFSKHLKECGVPQEAIEKALKNIGSKYNISLLP
jgi:FKBP-type peptidyl-prolyl cis-trans isomerase (trigger factor)